jgi:hypothetical protein
MSHPTFRVKRWAVKIHPVRTISRKDSSLADGWSARAGRELANRENFAKFVKASEVLRILRDHTPTLFPVSGEEDDMARTLRRRREVDGDVNPPLRM